YHLSKPAQALRTLSEICHEMLLLETCVTPGDEEAVNPEQEPAGTLNQASTGLGCRPTRRWVMSRLRESFGYAYNTRWQPEHADFELNWLQPASRQLYRSVFVGSKSELTNPRLSDTLCDLQNSIVAPRGIWFDVGAHLGETTFAQAQSNSELCV